MDGEGGRERIAPAVPPPRFETPAAKRGEGSTRPEMKQPPVSKRANGARRASGAARALERREQAAEQETT